MDEGFIDLRYGAERDAGGNSFWPSFTDIMMVVLMIFMIASTILMLRNMDLVRDLRASLASEREAEELAQSMTRTSATLEERLAQAQSEISELRIKLLRASEQRQALNTDLARVKQRARALQNEKQSIAARLQQAQRENVELGEARTSLQKTVEELRESERVTGEELALLREQSATSAVELENLRGSYDELSVKYNKLVRPARTAIGKYVVSVRYRKEGGIKLIEYRESENDSYEYLDRDELEARLDRLKAAWPGSLYVKVIIPKDSGLSYNEAWGFTQDVLTKYDYYYQD